MLLHVEWSSWRRQPEEGKERGKRRQGEREDGEEEGEEMEDERVALIHGARFQARENI